MQYLVAVSYLKSSHNNVCNDKGRIFEGTGFLSILPILLPTRESGIRRHKYLSAAIFKKAVHSDDQYESFQY